jgi:hypothetical protein
MMDLHFVRSNFLVPWFFTFPFAIFKTSKTGTRKITMMMVVNTKSMMAAGAMLMMATIMELVSCPFTRYKTVAMIVNKKALASHFTVVLSESIEKNPSP